MKKGRKDSRGMRRSFKILPIVVIALFFTGIIILKDHCYSSAVTEEKGVSQINLSIKPTKETFDLNEPISMELTFENKSDETVFLTDVFNVFQCTLQFDITMPSGRKPQEIHTAAGKMGPLHAEDFIKIPAGKTYHKIITLNERWYDLNQKGGYTVVATYSNAKDWSELSEYIALRGYSKNQPESKLQPTVWTGSIQSNAVSFKII